MMLVTLQEAKNSLKVQHNFDDADLEMRLMSAEALVLDYVNQRRVDGDAWAVTVSEWTEETVPLQVKAAILYLFNDFARFRGDDQETPEQASALLPGRVRMWLDRFRDPALS